MPIRIVNFLNFETDTPRVNTAKDKKEYQAQSPPENEMSSSSLKVKGQSHFPSQQIRPRITGPLCNRVEPLLATGSHKRWVGALVTLSTLLFLSPGRRGGVKLYGFLGEGSAENAGVWTSKCQISSGLLYTYNYSNLKVT